MRLLALRVLSPIWPVQLKGSPKVRGQHLVSAPLKQAESSRLQAGWLLLTFPGPAGGAAGAHCGSRVRALSETAPPNRNRAPANRQVTPGTRRCLQTLQCGKGSPLIQLPLRAGPAPRTLRGWELGKFPLGISAPSSKPLLLDFWFRDSSRKPPQAGPSTPVNYCLSIWQMANGLLVWTLHSLVSRPRGP